ncbi:NAD(P)/FAD-dependent oxidoreductase [Shouchella sp. JSM 1781072]|uniref:NAD(P)/FAD-dependent oxidoreductase n=1 Tax=Shouchella sp. JSM 1781072 TaxID=3344581 RepID=UPI0035C1C15E
MIDAVIIGGGPGGLSAALVLGRAKREVILFDEDQPRNQVTAHSHGFITQDGVSPVTFKENALADLKKYPGIQVENQRVTSVKKEGNVFVVEAEDKMVKARKVLLATGLKDGLPEVKGVHSFYGKSLFPCPFCDGWELRDQPLLVLAESDHAYMFTKIISNWSKDLVLATNGKNLLTAEQERELISRGIRVMDEKVESLIGEEGKLTSIRFETGVELERVGGFVTSQLQQASSLADQLDCKKNDQGGYEVDESGQSSVEGVYVAGDMTMNQAQQIVLAAANGSMAASRMVAVLAFEDF